MILLRTAEAQQLLEAERVRLPLDHPERHTLDPLHAALALDAALHPEHAAEAGAGES